MQSSDEIEALFYSLMKIQSDTGTSLEKDMSDYIYSWLNQLEYFKEHPHLLSNHTLPGDPYQRAIVWGLVKGNSPNTIILIHHHDVVDIFEYEDLKEVALNPDALKKHLKQKKLSPEVQTDLADPDWIFGRGSCDMKAGAAVQMWLMERYASEVESFNGSLLFLSVPDEENLSAGMRDAITLLNNLREEHGLNFVTTINSEPIALTAEKRPIFHEGTVGKIMPILYARGKKSHVGDVFAGFNPVWLLSQMHSEIELSSDFSDHYEGEVTPPPAWVYLRDQKAQYDASLPESAVAYFSILTLYTTPGEILDKLKAYAERSFKTCIQKYIESVATYNVYSKEKIERLNIAPRVVTLEELTTMLTVQNGPKFKTLYETRATELSQSVAAGELTLQEATIDMISYMLTQLNDHEPIIVIAFSGPFYPHVTNSKLKDAAGFSFKERVNQFTESHWGITYESKHYFMGISDLSYTSFSLQNEDIEAVRKNMPGWNILYGIPIEGLKKLSMPVVNLGPWGKDLHKITERVHKVDAFQRLPLLIEHVIDSVFNALV
ncbi:M20/M25/M40 family metallo-hydrolase [Acidaminobacter hydrogenoformans]|uniref:Arginine utilization protein RocB n=1 Tax=Acidaminobacter hydrogenoformans DSM 2784 TaxID=1120920 RepID=A0A1G5RYB4_9FIRM|nr:M20/M25/M40 family metallo-hydrolase [Acidaminobacter hydrogenoformans]SCZ78996.1 Arginine utilization protein RocB [Acidaminobacter hydrogenoformans DSM 2784]